jgi:putative heme-binding domain-containing protein
MHSLPSRPEPARSRVVGLLCCFLTIQLLGWIGLPLTVSWSQLGATPSSAISLPAGFEAELLYEVPAADQGSWVCLCVDLQGRLITSDQYGKLYRVDVRGASADQPPTVEPLAIDIGQAQGLLHTEDGLYVMVNGSAAPNGAGLYRLQDTNGDDQFDTIEQLVPLVGGGEHGPHAIIQGPNGRLYFCAGNATNLPEQIAHSRVPTNWSEDHLLGRMPDGNGFMADRLAPGGFIASILPDGSDLQLWSTGFRNQYDIAFNIHGDLFTFDADMEWDVGTPWYRPTRVNHAISGSEFGWRNGTGKWPAYFADSFGAVVNIGPGSPTGICFGYGARFPSKYQRALFIADWSYGVIYAVHLQPVGSTYTATAEPFISASPLPITDLVIHPHDGSMYFAVGGRRVQSALYRVRYSGPEPTDADPTEPAHPLQDQARSIRQQLEQLHIPSDIPSSQAIELAVQHVGSADRGIRTAARIALEHQPVAMWRELIEQTDSPQATITLAVALARCSDSADDQTSIQQALLAIDLDRLSRVEMLELLRAYQLSFTRLGESTPRLREQIVAQLNARFPDAEEDTEINRELATVLIYLQAPDILARALNRMQTASSADEQIHYAFSLREFPGPWSLDQRKDYLQWFFDVASARGGNSFGGFMRNIRNVVLNQLDPATRQQLGLLVENLPEPRDPLVDLNPRELVQEWTTEGLMEAVETHSGPLDFERGRQMFTVAQCFKCHRFSGQGGISGPDLTGAGGRFSLADLVKAIVEPDAEISDQYQAMQYVTDDGRVVVGRVANLNQANLMIMTNMLDPQNFTVLSRDDIVAARPSPVSMMPGGLLNTLTAEEIADLLAYIRSGGNPQSAIYAEGATGK